MGSEANRCFVRQVPALRLTEKFRSHIVRFTSNYGTMGKLGSDPNKDAHPDESDFSW
jgi:hypothetical protein